MAIKAQVNKPRTIRRVDDEFDISSLQHVDTLTAKYARLEGQIVALTKQMQNMNAEEKAAAKEKIAGLSKELQATQELMNAEAKSLGLSKEALEFRRQATYNQREAIKMAERQLGIANAELKTAQQKNYASRSEREEALRHARNKVREEEANLKEKQLLARDSGEKLTGAKTGIGRVTQEIGNSINDPNSFGNVFGDAIGNAAEKVGGSVGKALATPLGALGKTLGILVDVTMAMKDTLNASIDSAVSYLSGTYGVINANLDGAAITFKEIADNATDTMGLSQFVKQTDYLSNIAALTSQGIAFNVEQRALLETIQTRTLTSFSATEKYLLRLVRLREEDVTASQFGLEAILKRTLNSTFGDSSYLKDLYDSVTGALADVSTKFNGDITSLNSVVNTWLGAMYESGMNSSIIEKIATGINNLGSGNVTALASDADLQRLLLLSMDTIGLDYADVLQNGLSAADTNNLMRAIVEYLAQIADSTGDNNVLASAYTNLFNMSVSDLQAITNLSNNIGAIYGSSTISTGTAIAETRNQIANNLVNNTLIADRIDNVLENAKFSFGAEMATDSAKYLTFKASSFMLDLLDDFSNQLESSSGKVGKALGKIVDTAKLVPAVTLFGSTVSGLLSIANSLDTIGNNNAGDLAAMIGNVSYSTSGGEGTSVAGLLSLGAQNVAVGGQQAMFKSLSDNKSFQKSQANFKELFGDEASWAEDVGDESLDILKNLEGTIMQDKEGGNKAIAVFMQGMSDATLRSFASIFADEEAMEGTFEGKNNVLKDNLFNYANDTTSGSTKTS